MQLNLSEYSDNFLLQLLANDLIKRDKYVRYNLIIDQIEQKICIDWLEFAQKNKAYQKPMKCMVRFTEADASFTLTATLDPDFVEDVFDFSKRVKNTLFAMKDELIRKHNLDKVEIESIKVIEYHDVTKGI